jgi:PAS domain S-box-containing protein
MASESPENRPLSIAHESADEFRLFADSIHNLGWIADADGWIYWYNRRWYDYTGKTPEEMSGWGWQSVHDPDQLPHVLERWRESIATGEPFDMTFPLLGADGVFRSFLTRIIPAKDDQGRVQRWFGTNTDISRELAVADELRNSEARFRTATKAVDAILWTNIAAGEMLGEQAAWSTFTGQTPEQFSGYGWASALHPDDIHATLAAWQAAVNSRTLFAFEHRVRRHDGVYRLCSVRALPILSEARKVREWVGVHTDITEERDTQRTLRETVTALREQQELVDAAQLVSQVGFWRLRPEIPDLYLSAGSRYLLGLREDNVSFDSALARVDPEDRVELEAALRDSLNTGRFDHEYRVVPKDGEMEARYLRGVANVVSPPDQAPYLVGMNVDVTQAKRTAEALLRSEKLAVAGQFAASLSHEINNPLQSMTGLMYLLLKSALTPDQRELATALEGELARISRVATYTLRFHRQSTRSAAIDPASLVEVVLSLHAGRLRNTQIEVKSRLNATRLVLGFDGDIRQVLANLVENAIDAMHGIAGTRVLYIRSHDAVDADGRPGIRLTIADTGSGIGAPVLPKIFDPFFTTRSETRTGLGLWVAAEIVAQHGGSMRVRSSSLPQHTGTVFQVFLPATNETSPTAAGLPQPGR